MDKSRTGFRINLISHPDKPAIAEFDKTANKWLIKTDYPSASSLAGSCFVLSPDGSVDQITFDEEGYIIREVNVTKPKTS